MKLTRRVFFWITILGCTGLFLDAAGCRRSQRSYSGQRKPNIVFILADDLGYGDIGCYGQRNIMTPNLDRMARKGLRFTQFYAGATICAPSRCCLLTGVHTGHARIKQNNDVLLQAADTTVAKVLKRAGYMTACIGKWGLGHPPPPDDPYKNGFDHFFGYLSMWHAHNYYPEFLWRNGERFPLHNQVIHPDTFYKPSEANLVGYATQRVEYAPDLFTEDALAFVGDNQDQPFFLYLAYNIPHANSEMQGGFAHMGMEVPDYGRYRRKDWTEDRKGHAAMVSRMDRDIGRLLKRLKKLGLDRDTVVFFSSDNGAHADCRGRQPCHAGNAPFRGHKQQLYEGGIRVPLLVYWPGTIKPDTQSDLICAAWDMLPTLTQLGGAEPLAGTDGISLLPTLLGTSRQQTHAYLYWQDYRQGTYRRAVRKGRWKAVRSADDQPLELYDLSQDTGEQRDVATQFPKVVKEIETCMLEAQQTPAL